MQVRNPHPWPDGPAEAEVLQNRLRARLDLTPSTRVTARTTAGLDVAYDTGSERLAAAVVVMDVQTLQITETSTAVGHTAFDYVPGLFAFRELPALIRALKKITRVPDLLVADGQGIAHPRRFGLACHLGLLTDLPSIGVAKNALIGQYQSPDAERGSVSDLVDGGEVVGRALRTQNKVNPVFVSVGHKVDLDYACELTLRLAPTYRLPETIRQADQFARRALKEHQARDRNGVISSNLRGSVSG